ERFTIPTQYHIDIQTRCTLADWDGARLTVYESSQGVWNVKRELAKSLGLAEDAVRVVVKYMGGGFGSKAGAQRVVHYAARLAMMTARPVKLELTRPEEFLSHPRRYAAEATSKVGALRDGTLTAVDCDVILDLGSGSLYAGRYPLFLHQTYELYRCPNANVRALAASTNTQAIGWDRRNAVAASASGSKRRGIGMACYCLERSGYAPFSAKADVIVRRDGSVELRAGVVDIGAGQITMLPMLAAEELGIEPTRIAVHYGDTDG